MSAAGHEAPEGDGAAGEKPEGTVGETGEVQRAGTKTHQGRGLCLRLVGGISALYSKCTAVKCPNGSIRDFYCHQVSLHCNDAPALSGVTPFIC